MQFTRIIAIGAAVAVLAGPMAIAESHNTPEGKAIKARQSHMQLYAHNLGVLGAMAKGEMEFDANMAQGAADNLAALSGLNQMTYWLPGTSTQDSDKTRALPAIWQADSMAMAKGQELNQAAMKMAENAGSLDGVQANMNALGGACGACHKLYRQPEE